MSVVQSNSSYDHSDTTTLKKNTETRFNRRTGFNTKNVQKPKTNIPKRNNCGDQRTTITTSLNTKPKILRKAGSVRKNESCQKHGISDVNQIVDQIKIVGFVDTPPTTSSSEYSLKILDVDDKIAEGQSQLWNRKEYIRQKRFIESKKMNVHLPEIFEKHERSKKYRFADILEAQDSFEEDIRKFRQELHINFNENLSSLIDARQKTPCVQIERTLEKEKNRALRNEEINVKIEKYRERFLIRRQNQKNELILDKKKRREQEENFVINLALEDHHKLLLRPALKFENKVEDMQISSNESEERDKNIDLDVIENSLMKKIPNQPNNTEKLLTFKKIVDPHKPFLRNNSCDCILSPIKEHLTKSPTKTQAKVKKMLTLKPKNIKYKRFSLPLHLYGRKHKINYQQYKIQAFRVSSKSKGFFEKLIVASEKDKREQMRTKRHNRMKYLRIPIRKYVNKSNSFESQLCSSKTSFETGNWTSDSPLLVKNNQDKNDSLYKNSNGSIRNQFDLLDLDNKIDENIHSLESGGKKLEQDKENVYKSRSFYENDLPGKKKYLDLIKSITGTTEAKEDEVKCDKTVSNTSTIYTNFTNDSGSYIIFGEHKIPFNILRNPLISIEKGCCLELLKTEIADINTIEKKDRFHTYATRCRSDLRSRLYVPIHEKCPEMDNDLQTKCQILQETTTEIKKIYKCPQNTFMLKRFKPKSTLSLIRNAIRKKFEMHYINERIAVEDVNRKKEAEYAKKTEDLQFQYDQLFTIWKEQTYTMSMNKIYSMKPLYDTTDMLTQELNDLKKQKIEIFNNIILIKDDLIRRTILQKFHYLIAEPNWRQQHDDGTLEDYAVSIEKRKKFKRDCDFFMESDGTLEQDCKAIKKFYQKHFVEQKHSVEIVFDNWQHFVSSYIKLKKKTFIGLRHFHFTISSLINAENAYNQFKEWADKYIDDRTNYVNNRCSKKYLIENRVKSLEDITNNLFEKPLRSSLQSYKKMESLCEVLYEIMMPKNLIRTDSRGGFGPLEKLQIVFDSVIGLLAEIDKFPMGSRKMIERSYRKHVQYLQYKSREAYMVQERLRVTLKKLKRSFEPPPARKAPIKSTVKIPGNLLQKKFEREI